MAAEHFYILLLSIVYDEWYFASDRALNVIGHIQRENRGGSGIGGIAALFQHVDAGRDCCFMTRCDDALLAAGTPTDLINLNHGYTHPLDESVMQGNHNALAFANVENIGGIEAVFT